MSAGFVLRWCGRWYDEVDVLLDFRSQDGRHDASRIRPRTSATFSSWRRAAAARIGAASESSAAGRSAE
jgi:hypothetical protein